LVVGQSSRAAQMQVLRAPGKRLSPRSARRSSRPGRKKPAISIFDLINAVNTILKRGAARRERREIFDDKSVEKNQMLAKLIAEKGRIKFSELFRERHEPHRSGRNVSGDAG
jgi:hypothetical protein